MKGRSRKNISIGWMILCVLCVLSAFFLCIWKNGDVLLAETGKDPQDTVTAFFSYLQSGDMANAENCLCGEITLAADPSGLTEESEILSEALCQSYSCTLSGNCMKKGDTAHQTVLLSRLDVQAANNAAVLTAKTGTSYADALRTVLSDSGNCQTTDVLTIELRIEDGSWKICPDEAFLTALKGGLE